MNRIKRIFTLLCVFLIKIKAESNDFQNIIDEYQNGIDQLKQLANEYEFTDRNFDPKKYETTIQDDVDYDFIIIGAGTAGSVIANRLSEIPEWKVLLLEAGSAETNITRIPNLGALLQDTPYSWGFTSTPQKTWCLGMDAQKCILNPGKSLGGSSSINAMTFTRGNRRDYDSWGENNPGWSYKDMLPFFKKLENSRLQNFDSGFHHQGGPMNIENPKVSNFGKRVLEAAKELGIENADYNGKNQIGLAVPQINIKKGVRQSSGLAYLEPASERQNLIVKPSSEVIKILINEKKEAFGVEYLREEKVHVAKARKEIILSAGALSSPKLLMLSGIGPKKHLEEIDVKLIKDLHVGEGLRDHVGFIGLNFVYNQTVPQELNTTTDLIEYLKNAEGPLVRPFSEIEIIGFLKVNSTNTDPDYPDVELIFQNSLSNQGYEGLNRFNRINKETYNSFWKPSEGKQGFSVLVYQTHPKSSGVVKLKSKDPLHVPLVDVNALSDEGDHDVNTLVSGIEKVLTVVEAKALQQLGFKIGDNKVHGCEKYEFGSSGYWKCAVRYLSVSLRHFTGTAKMGPSSDGFAVVDNELKVYGVGRLRVADNSVIPVHITGHTMAVAIAIGEKASSLIKQQYDI